MEYEIEPIYKLINPHVYPTARRHVETFLKTMIAKGDQCSKAECSGQGQCVVDPLYFNKDWKNLEYKSIFQENECICNQDRMATSARRNLT